MQADNLFYKNTYMKEFDAVVTGCSENKGSYEVTLENTCFYPEGGGQPSDTGNIGASQVSHVFEKNGQIVHICDKPVEPGCIYPAHIDWERRFDHMQHHSAEHLISGVIHKFYGADNVGFHIGDDYVTVDYNVELSASNIEKIEFESNAAVFMNLPISVGYYESTPNFDYRSKKELEGIIRIVNIEGYDTCACCGTQLDRTGEIGLIKIISHMKYKSGSRLFMVCGFKALRDYNIKQKNADEISTLLSAKSEEIYSHVSKLYNEKEDIKRQLYAARNELIDIKISGYPGGDKLVLFEEGLLADEMRRFINGLADKNTLIAVFSGNDNEGYRYMAASNELDIAKLITQMNQKLGGKGGGKGIVSGFLTSSKMNILEFFSNI